MDSVKLLDMKSIYKNQFCFYKLTINYQDEKLRKQFHLRLRQKDLGIDLTI